MPFAWLQRALASLTRRQRRTEDAAVDAVVDELALLRKDVLAALVTVAPDGARASQLQELLALIDRLVFERSASVGSLVNRTMPAALALGAEQAMLGVRVGMAAGLLDISPPLVQAVVDVTRTQLTTVWGDLGESLQAAVRRVALGVARPDDVITALIPAIRDVKTFGTAAVRAEVIVRTEVNRAFALAADERQREIDAAIGGGLRKAWVAFTDGKTRKSHVDAGRRYGFNGTPIPITERFQVGGALLRYPLDPEGPAKEVINCRCRQVSVLPEGV